MASSQAILRGDHDDDDSTFLSLFAVQQAALRDKQAQMLHIMQQLEELEEEKEHSERECNNLAVMVTRLMLRERRTAGAQGHNSLPPEHVFRQLQLVAEPLEFHAATLRLPTSSRQLTALQRPLLHCKVPTGHQRRPRRLPPRPEL
ncbi:hypothetical protein HPB50_014175 [Hyalomma asiaticum]|uniref:Uncharacterized protein n=1 Tax=Hyalomma asiaticum TaxID=266040 RepID=A0ACB7SFH9_HYAAI|nr:hypothetical protein HPB50_014175 [Hyalomma asiaticum]